MGRYQNIKILTDSVVKPGVRFYATVRYPEIPLSENDIYLITVSGDRLDLIAQQYYGDNSLYWIISSANNTLKKDSLFVEEGTQIRVPADIGTIINKYNLLNRL